MIKRKDITIGMYEKYVSIFTNETKDGLEKKIESISLFSNLSIDEVCEMDIKEFKKLTRQLEAINFFSKKIIPEITLDGITYKSLSTTKEVKLNVKESFIIKNELEKGILTASLLMAILYRPVDNMNDFSEDGINQRKLIFESVSVDYILPYLNINEKS